MRRIRIVIHGKAAANPEVRDAVETLRGEGHRIEVRATWEAGDVERLVKEAAAEGVETVVAGGGDGTINEVATGLAQLGSEPDNAPTFGVLPLGTANDFARSAAIPLDPLNALRIVVSRPATPVDIGRVGENRAFVNMATGGFGTKITVETPEELKRVLGGAAYFLTGLVKFDSIGSSEGHFHGPGFEWQGSFLVLAVGNGRQAGGGRVLCPEARIDDGLLDVGILPDVPQDEIPAALRALLREGLGAVERAVITARVPWLEVQVQDEMSVNLDGEPIAGTSFKFEVLPSKLKLHLPDNSPLIKGG